MHWKYLKEVNVQHLTQSGCFYDKHSKKSENFPLSKVFQITRLLDYL